VINLDPDTGRQDGRALKTVVRLNANNAGVYGTVVQTGTIRVGQTVSLALDAENKAGGIRRGWLGSAPG